MPDRPRADAVGITTTIPCEVIFAAGLRPVDLNNVFITDPEPLKLVEEAERRGFPSNMCCWIKGIYAAAHHHGIRRVVGVVQGDCSNTHALMEIWQTEGLEVVEFAFPYNRNREALDAEINRLCAAFGVNRADAEKVRERLQPIRAKAHEVDRLCAEEGKATGFDSHLWMISCSDFNGDYEEFDRGIMEFLESVRGRRPRAASMRLGLAGIPPICSDLYDVVRDYGGEIVFNETQRQFSMPFDAADLTEQYVRYLYPYDVFSRVDDLAAEIRRRGLDGLIHYVQSFCFRQLHDRILRERLDVPILTLECDRPGPMDGRSHTRIEAFLEMIHEKKKRPAAAEHD
ncbi:MAG: 2-hydroxyacyl-CoA dehydratase [Planctomycetes bacterium]|nr:2-hydroxyacyl-CoA dehydratase [Planctomycetota bacterium]